MQPKYDLSETEFEIMEMFWESGKKFNSREILEYFNDVKQKKWKKQTLNTYLTRLKSKGFISTDYSAKKNLYICNFSKDEYRQNKAKQFLNDEWGGSISEFLVALSGGNTLSKADADDIRKSLGL